jgi:hypothetical protein
MAAKKKKVAPAKLNTKELIELAKSKPNKWLWASKRAKRTTERHWLCWRHSRLYHFLDTQGQPKVVEVSLFRIEHEDAEWKLFQ